MFFTAGKSFCPFCCTNTALPLNAELVKEVVKKTQEEVDFFILDWKGVGNSEQRKQLIDVLEKNYVAWKKTSEIDR